MEKGLADLSRFFRRRISSSGRAGAATDCSRTAIIVFTRYEAVVRGPMQNNEDTTLILSLLTIDVRAVQLVGASYDGA